MDEYEEKVFYAFWPPFIIFNDLKGQRPELEIVKNHQRDVFSGHTDIWTSRVIEELRSYKYKIVYSITTKESNLLFWGTTIIFLVWTEALFPADLELPGITAELGT